MNRAALIGLLVLIILPGCGLSIDDTTPTDQPKPQIGFNFIRLFSGLPDDKKGAVDLKTTATQPDTTFKDFDDLGNLAYRQFTKADLGWNTIEPKNGEWHFTEADEVIKNGTSEPIVTLFSLQYASPTPPWSTGSSTFQKSLSTADAREYVAVVANRYKDDVTYWEIGNELDHWRAADPGTTPPEGAMAKLPVPSPKDGFSPEEQGTFLNEVAAIIKRIDHNAIIVLPGMSSLDSYTLDTWLPGVAKSGDWFDVVNYHYYGDWKNYDASRNALTKKLTDLGLQDKPVWLTETGSTSSRTLKTRTNYPNSETSQAADIFRRIIPAYAAGDSLVLWHTYIGSPSISSNPWRDYGVLDAYGNKKPAYYAFKLLSDELLPFSSVEAVPSMAGSFIYKITTTSGHEKYVGWGTGTWNKPAIVTQMTSAVPNKDGSYSWTLAKNVTLSDIPVIMREGLSE